MQILEFIFQSFWHFIGFLILLYIVMYPLIILGCGLIARSTKDK